MKKVIIILSVIIISLQANAQKRVPIIVPPLPPGVQAPPPPPGTKFVVAKPGQPSHGTYHRKTYHHKKYYKKRKHYVKKRH